MDVWKCFAAIVLLVWAGGYMMLFLEAWRCGDLQMLGVGFIVVGVIVAFNVVAGIVERRRRYEDGRA